MNDQARFNPVVPTITWNRDALNKELNTKVVAQRDARKGDPRPNDTQFPFYNKVKVALEQVVQEGRTDLQNHIDEKQRELIEAKDCSSSLRHELDEATLKLAQICHSGIGEIDPFAKKVQETEDEFITFVEENNLDHRVANPQKTMGIWLILVLAFVELLVNGWSLGSAHVDGFVGAIYEIILFTLFNVVVGIAIGELWRQSNKRPSTSASVIVARCLIPVLVFAVFFFGYLFAHYRDALISLQSIASTDIASFLDTWGNLFTTTWNTAFSDDWVPNTMPSVVLMLACCLISTFVAIEWYRHDDPYPGFGPLSRKREDALQKYAEKVEEVTQVLSRRADDAKNFCAGKRIIVQSAHQIPDRVSAWGSAYETFVGQLTAFALDQLRTYRQINRRTHAWPDQLDQQIEEFKFKENLTRIPQLTEVARDALLNLDEVSDLVDHVSRVVNYALSGYSGVFAPPPALHPKHDDYEKYNKQYAAHERIKEQVERMKNADGRIGD